MAVLKFLGTSSSIPSAKRDNTSFLFSHKNNTFLIDCPGSISHKLLKAGENFKKINKIIITHDHCDHIYGLPSLVHTQMGQNKEILLFASQTTLKTAKKLISLFKLDKPDYPKIRYVDALAKNNFYCRGSLKLNAVKNKHSLGSFGVRFEFEKKSLLYSSDTAFSSQLLKAQKKIDYLIHDCTGPDSFFQKNPSLYQMHTSSRQLAAYLENNPQITFIPVHFLLANKVTLFKIKKELSGIKKIIFVKDFQKIILKS